MRDRIVSAARRVVEAVLPWYDPQRDDAHDRRVDRTVRNAKAASKRLASYGRVVIRK